MQPDRTGPSSRSGERLLWLSLGLAWLLSPALSPTGTARAGETTMTLEVDARDLPRKLLHARVRMPATPGSMAFWYPRWIPGTHAPCGPLAAIGGLTVEDPAGRALPWRRGDVDLHRVTCDVPAGVREIVVRLDLICNTAAVEASGYLSYGNASVGIINWPTILVYPEGPPASDIRVATRLRLPAGWTCASALAVDPGKGQDGQVAFRPVSLEDLADSPLIAGEHVKTITLDAGKGPPASFHMASESPAALELPAKVVDQYGRMVREAAALFGACHYPEFRFLVTCSDELGYLGLEHHASSLNGVRERDLIDDANRRGWVANLIPHEYVHSWCGKYRRPAGMCTTDFHTPQKTRLLWVYEGLTEYLGEVVMVRSGLVTPEEYRKTLTSTIGDLVLRKGRGWQALEDTAVASHLLRSPSPNWSELRRNQDYYQEGALLWLEADSIIRERSEGKRSLDDFCRKFLGEGRPGMQVVPYELPEVLSRLAETVPYDWETFVRDRVSRPLEALSLDFVGRLGYRFEYLDHPTAVHGGRRDGEASARHSLGLAIAADGRILDVVPGMPGDRARLAPGTRVAGVNGRVFSPQRLTEALVDGKRSRKVELLTIQGDRFRTVVIDYDGGPRYPALVRIESRPDILARILEPLTPGASGVPAPAHAAGGTGQAH